MEVPPGGKDGTYGTNGTYVPRLPPPRARARLSCGAPTWLWFWGYQGLQAGFFTDFFEEKTRQNCQGLLPKGGDLHTREIIEIDGPQVGSEFEARRPDR